MSGRQREIYEGLMDLASKVESGFYGTGDDIDEDVFRDDVVEITEAD